MTITTVYYPKPSPLAQDWAGTGRVKEQKIKDNYRTLMSFIGHNSIEVFVSVGVMKPTYGYIVPIKNTALFAVYEDEQDSCTLTATFNLTLQQAQEKLAYIEA